MKTKISANVSDLFSKTRNSSYIRFKSRTNKAESISSNLQSVVDGNPFACLNGPKVRGQTKGRRRMQPLGALSSSCFPSPTMAQRPYCLNPFKIISLANYIGLLFLCVYIYSFLAYYLKTKNICQSQLLFLSRLSLFGLANWGGCFARKVTNENRPDFNAK